MFHSYAFLLIFFQKDVVQQILPEEEYLGEVMLLVVGFGFSFFYPLLVGRNDRDD